MNPDAPLLCVLLGGGGHARMLMEILRPRPDCKIVGILDADPNLHHQMVQEIPVLGTDDLLPGLRDKGVTHFALGVGSTSHTASRQQLFDRAAKCGLIPLDVRHPTALVASTASIGPGVQLFPYAVVNAGSQLGRNVLINTGAIVEHDCQIEDHVHVASRAVLCGQVRVGYGTHVGAGAVVRQNIRIGRHCLIGAGAVVVHDVPDGFTVLGVPARPKIPGGQPAKGVAL